MDPYKLIVSSEVTSVIFISKYGEEQRPGGPTLTKVAYSMMDWFSDSGEEIPMVIELDKNFRN